MILTKSEAERILTKMFQGEVNEVEIENTDTSILNNGTFKTLVDDVLRILFLKNQEKIMAIKLYRYLNPNKGLAEAKKYVESL